MRESPFEGMAFGVLAASVFFSAFSLPAGRFLLLVSAILVILHSVRTRQVPRFPVAVWLGLAFMLLAVRATIWGLHPDVGIPRLDKLAWFLGLPVGAVLITTRARLTTLACAYGFGCAVLALKSGVGHALKAGRLVATGEFADFGAALVYVGSMTDSQRLMVGVLLVLGLLLAARGINAAAQRWWGGVLALLVAVLVMNFKRGAWFSTVAAVGLFLVIRGGWRYVALLAVLVGALLAVPQVRTRLCDLQHEFRAGGGGRMTMWTQIAPALVREHPWGIGYRSLTNADMRAIAPGVEPRRDHLHSNYVQVLVDTGWLGLGVFLLWMGWIGADGVRFYAREKRGPFGPVVLGVVMALVALLFNGFVEYNFGDGELVLAYGLLMGACAGSVKRA